MSYTINCFSSLVIAENFFAVNRNYLIQSPSKRRTCNFIFLSVFVIIILSFIFDAITSESSDMYTKCFQAVLLFELINLCLVARFRKTSFVAMVKLDEKCGTTQNDFSNIRGRVKRAVVLSIVSVILDMIGLKFLMVKLSVIVTTCVSFAAHDTEMAFLSLLIGTINMRLSKLKNVHPNFGSKVYRHVLVASSYINEEFAPRVLLMLGITLFTTVVYAFILILAESEMKLTLAIYLVWRELKSFYSLYLVCSAAAQTETICDKLAFHLASRLAIDPGLSKEKNPVQYRTVRRWFSTVRTRRPRFISGSVLTFGLSVPLLLIDTSINYMLIIVQIYVQLTTT